MPPANELDLSGQWSGLYNYPHTHPPTAFEAVIRDSGGLISGETTEPSLHRGSLHALIDGRREGAEVRFTKIYDDFPEAASWIQYVGTIAEGGDEIHGRWHIPGTWSGSFLMIRGGGAKAEAERLEEVEIPI